MAVLDDVNVAYKFTWHGDSSFLMEYCYVGIFSVAYINERLPLQFVLNMTS